ncbi:MAG: SufD family Fe-S cluster assembly protein [Erysipelotrichales bacterium]|nr:SufD family Fe-S cluster assembly protein [Erysipelotrichales bacterium]
MENNLLKLNGVSHSFLQNTLVISIGKDAQFADRIIFSVDEIETESIEIICKEDSNAKLLIKDFNENKKITFKIGKNAEFALNFISIDNVAKGKYHFILEENSRVVAAMADLAKGNINIDVLFDLVGDYSSAEWHLASLGASNDNKVFNINFNHMGKDTNGIMANYGVVEDESFMHFKGDSHIKKGSIRSKAHQSAKIMVFDEKCHAKANPILKIDENDIEASHAAVVGKVNDEHMYYLCSRGISESDAKQLITFGYLKPIVNYFADKNDVDFILNGIEKRL